MDEWLGRIIELPQPGAPALSVVFMPIWDVAHNLFLSLDRLNPNAHSGA